MLHHNLSLLQIIRTSLGEGILEQIDLSMYGETQFLVTADVTLYGELTLVGEKVPNMKLILINASPPPPELHHNL